MLDDDDCSAEDIGGNLGGPCQCARCRREDDERRYTRAVIRQSVAEQRRADDLACETAENTADMTTLDLAEQFPPGSKRVASQAQVNELAAEVRRLTPVMEAVKTWRQHGWSLGEELDAVVDAAIAKENANG